MTDFHHVSVLLDELVSGLAPLSAQQQPASAGQSEIPPPQGRSYDYCVACTGPQAVYVCTVGPRQPDPGAGRPVLGAAA